MCTLANCTSPTDMTLEKHSIKKWPCTYTYYIWSKSTYVSSWGGGVINFSCNAGCAVPNTVSPVIYWSTIFMWKCMSNLSWRKVDLHNLHVHVLGKDSHIPQVKPHGKLVTSQPNTCQPIIITIKWEIFVRTKFVTFNFHVQILLDTINLLILN